MDKTTDTQLVFWAGNSLLERASTPLTDVRRRLDDLGVELNVLDPYLAWYPGYDPAAPGGGVPDGRTSVRCTDEQSHPWTNQVCRW